MATETDELVTKLRADSGYCRGAGQNRLADDIEEAVEEILRLRGIARDHSRGRRPAEAVPTRYPRRRRRLLGGLLR